MAKFTAFTVLALLVSSEAFSMSPMTNKISARRTNTSLLKMTAAEDEVAQLIAKAAKMRDEAQQLEKVRQTEGNPVVVSPV